MMVTEEEAMMNWCPAMTTRRPKKSEALPDLRCLGSDCMAWRWAEMTPPAKVSKTLIEGWVHIRAEDADDGVEYWIEPDEKRLERRRGYCGLAGKPEYHA